MTEGEEHLWHIELDMMRQKVRFAMENLDELPKRTQVLIRALTASNAY